MCAPVNELGTLCGFRAAGDGEPSNLIMSVFRQNLDGALEHTMRRHFKPADGTGCQGSGDRKGELCRGHKSTRALRLFIAEACQEVN